MNDYISFYKVNEEQVIAVCYDECAESPREWLGNDELDRWHLVCAKHRRYDLPCEKHPTMTRMEMHESGEYQIVPLSFLDHSQQYLLIGSIEDWDATECGYAWRKKDGTDDGDGLKWLKGDLDAYNNWANGSVFGCVLMDFDGNELDSCYGFIADCSTDAVKWYAEDMDIEFDVDTAEEVKPKYRMYF